MEDDVCEEYNSSLADLSCNSKPLINMLTMLAEDNVKTAPKIVQVIESHLQKVSPDVKLPVLYLIDSIIKNVGGPYQQLFTQNIVSNFCSVFEKVEEKTRIQLFKLRQTWNEVFPSKKLYAIDVRVKSIDPAWPVTAQPNIHVNPKFLESKPVSAPNVEAAAEAQAEVRRQLLEKQQELLRLQQQRLELEKLQIQAQLEKQKLSEISKVAPQPPRVPQPNRPQPQPSFNQFVRGPDPNLSRRDPRMTGRDPRMQRNLGTPSFPTEQATAVRTPLSTAVSAHFVSNKPNIISNATPPIVVNSCTAATTVISTTTSVTAPTNSNNSSNQPDIIFISENSGPKRTELSKKFQNSSVSGSENKDKKGSPPKQNSQTTFVKSSPKKNSQISGGKNTDSTGSSKNKKDDLSKLSPNKCQKDKKDGKSDKQSKLSEIVLETNLSNKNQASPKKKSRESLSHDKEGKQASKEKKGKDEASNKKKSTKKSNKNKGQDLKTQKPDENTQESGDVDLRVQATFSERTSLHEDGTRGRKNAVTEVDENADEPVRKKAKDELSRVDSLFGEEDKDYRIPQSTDVDSNDYRIPRPTDLDSKDYRIPRVADVDSRTDQKNWAQYKASHPDEFQSPARPTREIMPMDTDEFQDDQDFRNQGKFHYKMFRGPPPRESGFDRLGRPLLSRMKSFPRWRHVSSQYDYDPNIQHQMHVMLSNRDAIIRQAEEQFRSGRITSIQHQEFLADLKRLNEFQNNSRVPLLERWINARRNDMEGMNDPVFYRPTGPRDTSRTNDLPGEPVFIDGDLRRIHFFGGTAVVFVSSGEAREVCFQGSPIDVFLDDMKLFSLEFNRIREFELNGTKHQIRFGAPSREVYIDGRPYKAQFGGNPFRVFISGKAHQLRLGGPQPSVEIGTVPMNDFVEKFTQSHPRMGNLTDMNFRSGNNTIDVDMRDAPQKRSDDSLPPEGHGFLNMKDIDMRVINARTRLEGDIGRHSPMHHSPDRNTPPRIPEENLGPGRPPLQNWEEGDRRDEHIHPNQMNDSYRNLPSERDARWGSPNRDFSQGMDWQTKDQMEWEQHNAMPNNGQQFGKYPSSHDSGSWNGPPPPQEGSRGEWDDWRLHNRGSFRPSKGSPQHYDDYQYPGNSNTSSVPPHVPPQRKAPFNPVYRGPGPRMAYRMPGVRPGGFVGEPRAPPPKHIRPGINRYPLQPRPNFPANRQDEVANKPEQTEEPAPTAPQAAGLLATPVPATENAAAAPVLDINSLFAKLVSVGLIQSESSDEPSTQEKPVSTTTMTTTTTTTTTTEETPQVREKEVSKMPAVELTPESLKGRYPEIAAAMYKGIQCASCGLRFSEVQNEKYRQHLDWHFRSNRREKDGAKKPYSRKWYYDVEDWTQFEEVEDLEDRAQSFFELQADEEQFQAVVQPVIASVPTSKEETDNVCVVCGERFEPFWVEEEEEWHLKDAVRIEDKTYHPLCFEDFKKAQEAPETPVEDTNKSLDESMETDENKETKAEEIEEVSIKEIKEEEEMESSDLQTKIETSEEPPLSEDVEESKKETEESETIPNDEAIAENDESKEVPPEEPTQPEEEIIGLISETDPTSDDEMPKIDSEMVVMQSGNIVMKVKAESIAQPVLSTPPPSTTEENSESAQKTDVETDTEDELILPPPDPRFTVLPPVQRGQELSGLCSIM